MERLTDIEVIAGQVHPIPRLELQNPSGFEKIVSRLQEIEDILGDTYDLDRLLELVEENKKSRDRAHACAGGLCKNADARRVGARGVVCENQGGNEMKGYKGFDKNLKCYGGYQYEIGRTETTDKAELCEAGFHACEHPLDCLNYYEPGESRYCDVDLDDVTDEHGEDSKRVGKKITVQGEIGIAGLVKAAVNIGIEETKSKTTGDWAHAATTGDRAHAATTGDGAHAATTGDRAHAATTGDGAHAEVSGKESIASALGIEGEAKGALGCWIVCAEWESKNEGWHIKCVKAVAVDGEKIKADTWYMLEDGEFVEATDDED